jgi:hypothetical protein
MSLKNKSKVSGLLRFLSDWIEEEWAEVDPFGGEDDVSDFGCLLRTAFGSAFPQ